MESQNLKNNGTHGPLDLPLEKKHLGGLIKLNLGAGFKKKAGFVNVDIWESCQPEVRCDLSVEVWPWADESVGEVVFDFSLEEMGESKKHLLHILKELYRVCAVGAKIFITCADTSHDQFASNPLAVHKLSPSFFQLLSVQNNLNQIANGLHYTCLALNLGVNFGVTRVKHLLTPEMGREMETQNISELQVRRRMLFERNVIQAFEVDLERL